MREAKYEIIFSDNLDPWLGGKCMYPFIPLLGKCKIIIKPKYKNDIGIHKHEIKHAEQYANNFFHALKSTFSKTYRYNIELEAYTEQIKVYKYSRIDQTEWIIDALVNKYNLNITRKQVIKDITIILQRMNNETDL